MNSERYYSGEVWIGGSIVKRGGYSKEKKFLVKFRARPALYQALKEVSREENQAMAMLIRDFVSKGLEQRRAERNVIP
jgi:hypothetical protein